MDASIRNVYHFETNERRTEGIPRGNGMNNWISTALVFAQGSLLVACSASEPPAITPDTLQLRVGTSHTFTSLVANTRDQRVTWSAVADCGTMNDQGTYTAPANATSCSVRATSRANPTAMAEASVTVTPPIADPDGFNSRYVVNATCDTAVSAAFPTGSSQIDAGAMWSERFVADDGFAASLGAQLRCQAGSVTVVIWRWLQGDWQPIRNSTSSGDFVTAVANITY